MSSYLDKDYQWTIKYLFKKAAHPEWVFVGIGWQCILEEDEDLDWFSLKLIVDLVHFIQMYCKRYSH